MLTATVVVMSVMGCGDGVVSCSTVQGPEQVWTSQAACEQAIPGVLRQSLTLSYPVIAARCSAKGADPAGTALIAADTRVPFKAVRIEPAVAFLNAEELAALREEPQSVTGAILSGTKRGFALAGDGVSATYGAMRTGARFSYGALRDGLSVSLDASAKLTRKATGLIQGALD